ncbi:MAG: hypothetical protein H8Z69_02210 [Nanohaloarchaea archaeon]|nr:hypothetical protein [Candidatus Nanohaloarchaea archaeon]
MAAKRFDFSPTHVGTEVEVPESYEEEIVETARSWNYPGDANGRDIHVNSDHGRIKVVDYDDSIEVYDQGAGIEGFREAFPKVFQNGFEYQRTFESGKDEAEKAAPENVEVFEFDDEVVIAGERSEVRDTVFETRQELGKEYGEKSSWEIQVTEESEKAVVTDGGFPTYDGTRHREMEDVDTEDTPYMGHFNTP